MSRFDDDDDKRMGRALARLTVGSTFLWPLGTGLGFFFGNDVAYALCITLGLTCFFLLVITIMYACVFLSARQMWRKSGLRREDENDGAAPEGGNFSDPLHMLLGGLSVASLFFLMGLCLAADAGLMRFDGSVGRLVFFTCISCWALEFLYLLIFRPLRSLFKYLARRKARQQTDAAPKDTERTATGDAASKKSARARREREQREREERLRREREEREQREREERARREREEERRRREEEGRRARFSSRDEQAFALLGLEPGAKFAAIKKAYRKLIVQYHPDKVGHLGEEYRRIATEKTKEINAAYRYLEERFGKCP